MKLTLGFSPCPNDTFIFDALVHGKIDTEGLSFDVHYDDVETLNRKAFRGELDVTKLSYHAFAHVVSRYALLDAGSALGFGVGPLLIAPPLTTATLSAPSGDAAPVNAAQVNSAPLTAPTLPAPLLAGLPLSAPSQNGAEPDGPADVAEAARIGIPGRYTTANLLLGLAFPAAKNKQEMVFSAIEEALLNGEIDLGLIIHENRFTYEKKGLRKIMDLGEFWEKETGFPIPLGGIMVRRDLPSEVREKVNRLIRRSVEYAFANPSSGIDFIRAHAQEMEESVMYQHIELYVNKYSVDLGQEGRRAVEVLLEMGAAKGVIPPVTEPVFSAG